MNSLILKTVTVLACVFALYTPLDAAAASYNAGISTTTFSKPTAVSGETVKVSATLRNLQAIGIFTVLVDVSLKGQAVPSHSFSCKTPELRTGAVHQCSGNFVPSRPGQYQVRARAANIDGNHVFPGAAAFPGIAWSALLTVAGAPVTPQPPLPPAVGEPLVNEQFTSNVGNSWYVRTQATGAAAFGVADAAAGDGRSLSLRFAGNPAFASDANAGPHYATEVGTVRKLHHGRYETRVRFASCQSSEEVVNGIFTYHNDGSDENRNGIADQSEIDIELLCGEPQVLWLTTWTDYSGDDSNQFRKRSRAIDMRTGHFNETPVGREQYHETLPAGNLPAVRLPDFPKAGQYYTVGFDWHPDRVRWYIVLDRQEITLWDMRDVTMVPRKPGSFLFNVWHSAEHWFNHGPARFPGNDAVMHVDYFRFTPLR